METEIMMRTWQLQEAKNKFSEVVAEAVNKGPQLITKRGTEAVIVVSYEEFQKLVDHRSEEEQEALFASNAMRIYRA